MKLSYEDFEKIIIELFAEKYDEPLNDVLFFADNLRNSSDYLQSLYIESVEEYEKGNHNFEDNYLSNQPVRLLELIYSN